ncbi:MAG: ribonuclease III [Deltaproteobacteria bacterium]|nr:ribonuclease III [Deltaproteobacteria bacterium]
MTRLRISPLKKLPFIFKDQDLIEEVFVHSSYLNEKKGKDLKSNERLEFLGDAVLATVVSHILYSRFTGIDEGELTKLRSRLVNKRILARLSKDMGLAEYLMLGKGEALNGGRENPSILSDLFEALVGAVYLDSGYEGAYKFIEERFLPLIEKTLTELRDFDFKPELQELVQKRFKEEPCYRLIREEGRPHKKTFEIEVIVAGKALGRGIAARKKDAEQLAAKEALSVMRNG